MKKQSIKHFWQKQISNNIMEFLRAYNVFDFHWIDKKCKQIKQLEKKGKWSETKDNLCEYTMIFIKRNIPYVSVLNVKQNRKYYNLVYMCSCYISRS